MTCFKNEARRARVVHALRYRRGFWHPAGPQPRAPASALPSLSLSLTSLLYFILSRTMVAASPATPRPGRGSGVRPGPGPGGRGGANRGGRGSSQGAGRVRTRPPPLLGDPRVAAAVDAVLQAHASPAAPTPANPTALSAESPPSRRCTRSATRALLPGAQPVLVAPHEDPERVLRSRPTAVSVDTGKGWFVDHLRELGRASSVAGASGADAFLEKLLENDWR